MGHTPYIPDLAHNDFSPAHQEKMRVQRFLSSEDAVEVFKNHVLEVSQSEWKSASTSVINIRIFINRLEM